MFKIMKESVREMMQDVAYKIAILKGLLKAKAPAREEKDAPPPTLEEVEEKILKELDETEPPVPVLLGLGVFLSRTLTKADFEVLGESGSNEALIDILVKSGKYERAGDFVRLTKAHEPTLCKD